MATIEVQTKIMGHAASGTAIEPVFLELVEETITARELIRRAVMQQIHELSFKRRLDAAQVSDVLQRQYLSESEIAAQSAEGRIKMPGAPEELKPVNVENEIARAMRAFEGGRVFLYAGGRQVENLDEELDFSRQSKVTFLRLTPLMGG